MTDDRESLEIRASDGAWLGASLCEPRHQRVLGTAILAHPMFANKAAFARPRGQGVAEMFEAAGWRTLAFDFRGHGASTTRGESLTPAEQPWGYDDLVRVDLPTVAHAARARWPRSRLVVVGHSLGGHVALAAQGAGLIDADALVIAGGNVWMRHLETSRRVWLSKLATIRTMAAIARARGRFPARALGLGSDDEATPYIEDLARFADVGRWTSRDGAVDYEAALASIRVPTFSLTSAGDRLYCRPDSAARMLATLPECTHHCIVRADGGGPPPGHMGILTNGAARSAWRRALGWLDPRGSGHLS